MVASVASCLQKIELWYPSFGLQAIDCDLGCLIYATAASQWRIVEIQFLASLRWKPGCQPFSCRCSQKWLTAEKRFVPHVCPRNPCLLILLWNLSLRSLPEAWVPESGIRYGWIMPIPSLQLQEKIEKACLMQRSRGFGHRVVVSKICYVQYSDCVQDLDYRILIVLSVVTCDCCEPMNDCRDWAFSNSGLEVGLSMFVKCNSLPTRDLFDMFVQGIHSCNSFWEFQSRSRFLRAAARSTHSALWLHHAHPFVAVTWKTCLIEISRGFGHGVVVLKICYNAVIVLSVVTCDCCKPMNDCRDWAFSNSGLEVGLSMFVNATHCQQEICLTCLSKESIPATPFGNFNQEAGSWERRHAPPTLHCGCIMPIPSLQLHEKPVS